MKPDINLIVNILTVVTIIAGMVIPILLTKLVIHKNNQSIKTFHENRDKRREWFKKGNN